MQIWTLVVDRGVSFASAFESLKADNISASAATEPVTNEDGGPEQMRESAKAKTSPVSDVPECSDTAGTDSKPWDTTDGNYGFWKVIYPVRKT